MCNTDIQFFYYLAPWIFFLNRDLYRGTSHWFLTGLGICSFTLNTLNFRSLLFALLLKEWLWANHSCHSLKKQLCANCSPCTFLKTKVSDLIFFTSKLLFRSQKTSDSLKKIIFFVCFWHFLTVFHSFPLFNAQKQIAPVAHYKRVILTLY